MTDFATEILPEEEEKVEELLPRQEDAQAARQARADPGRRQHRPRPELARVGNAVLAQELGDPGTPSVTAPDPGAAVERATLRKPPNGREPELTPMPDPPQPEREAPPAPRPEMDPEPGATTEKAAALPKADPTAERRDRLKLLTRTLSSLLRSPEDTPIDALFAAFLDAPAEEQADAALAIANAVLRIDADNRRRTRIVLARAMSAHKAHPLVQMLAIRLGAWGSTAHVPPPSPEPVDTP